MEINSHILKISGNAELPKELKLGDNYEVVIQGTVVKSQDSDNHDGTYDRQYTIKPIMVGLVDSLGESIKSKDTRSQSQLYRGLIKKIWIEKGIDEDFETFYKKVYKKIYKYTDTLVNEVLNEKN